MRSQFALTIFVVLCSVSALLPAHGQQAQLPAHGQSGQAVAQDQASPIPELIRYLRAFDRGVEYRCFRNVSNYEDREFLSQVVRNRYHYREASGDIYANAYLVSTLPPLNPLIPQTATWKKVSDTDFILQYERETTVIGRMKEISDTVHAFRRPGLARHHFKLENGGLRWVSAAYDVAPYGSGTGAMRPHVRCARIVEVKGRYWGTNQALEPLQDIRLGGGWCNGSGAQCAESVREPMYLN